MTEREKFLCDVFTTIMEDYGTNPWRRVIAYRWQNLGPNFFGKILECGDDEPSAKSPQFEVNRHVIARGLNMISANVVKINSNMQKNIALANKTNGEEGDIDAYDADMILQAGIFNGELRYG